MYLVQAKFIYTDVNVEKQNHSLSIKQAKLSKRSQAKLTTFILQQRASKQHENNRKSERGRQRERQRDRMLLCQQLFVWVCYSRAKRPDWVMKSRTALNINEFSLFGMSGSPWRNLYQAYTRFDYFQQQKCCTLPTLFLPLWHHNYDALDEVLASSLCQCLPVKEKSRTRIQLTRNAYFLKLWFLTVCMNSQSSSRTSHICSNYEYSSKLWEITVAENKSFWLAESFRPARLFFERSASAAHNLW